jgi:hypothetical protein
VRLSADIFHLLATFDHAKSVGLSLFVQNLYRPAYVINSLKTWRRPCYVSCQSLQHLALSIA